MAKKPKCDCHLHERQVCDICQGVKGKVLRDKRPAKCGLQVLRKTAEVGSMPGDKSLAAISLGEVIEANRQAKLQAREGWKDLSVEKTVSRKGVVRRKNINYGRDTTSKLLPKLNAGDGPLFTLNRLLGLSEINQALIEIQSGDLPLTSIPVTVHLPQINKVIETELVPRYRFGKGFRRQSVMREAISGKKRMVMVELGSDSDRPQLQITFY